MRKRESAWVLGTLVLALATAWGQDSSSPTPGGAGDSGQAQGQIQQEQEPQPVSPIPAYGEENAPPPVSENPPISGLDLPSLEPHAAPLSYLQPGATASETADSNVLSGVGGQSFISVTRAVGSMTLQRLWSHYDLAADYFGGAAYYHEAGLGWKALQQADIDQKITWKRGELSLRDSFSYLPEGNFGSPYGSQGSQGIASLGTSAFGSFWGGSELGTYGLNSRIMNVSIGDISENLTPKSSVTAAAGYALTHFYGPPPQSAGLIVPATLIGSSQFSAQVGYDRILTPATQVAVVYGYQGFDFTVFGSAFHSNIVQLMYGHRITGRLDFLIAAGPQFTHLVINNSPDFRVDAAGQMRFRYRFSRGSIDLSYQRFLTGGSGIFAGAESDIAQLSGERRLTRVWDAFADIGYAHNKRFQSLSLLQELSCVNPGVPNPSGLPSCPGVDANTFNYGFIGGGVHRAFGHDFHGFASYQFNKLSFDHSYCGGLSACNRIGNRQVITIGLDWTPRPIRLD